MTRSDAACVAEREARLYDFAQWLLSMDDPEDVLGREERRTVTLTKIIDRAREALDAEVPDVQA